MREKHLAKLVASVVVSSIFLTGCGGDATEQAVAVQQNEENNSGITGIHVTDGAKYQYQLIDPEDIIIEYGGLEPDQSLADYKGKYMTDSSVYLGDQVGVYLGEEHYTATVNEYVPCSNINWKWDREIEWDLFINTRKGDTAGDVSQFKGIIDYADGTQSSVTADSVGLDFEDNGNTEVVSIKFRDDTYTYKFAIPKSWWDEGDGSDLSAEELKALRGQNTEMTQDGASNVSYVYSLKDVPELTNVDWDLFNKYMVGSNFDNGKVPGDIFSCIGRDVRVDWSYINDTFNQYYGNTDSGMKLFVGELVETYFLSLDIEEVDNVQTLPDYCIVLSPIFDKIQNGDYDDLVAGRVANVDSLESSNSKEMSRIRDSLANNEYYYPASLVKQGFANYVLFGTFACGNDVEGHSADEITKWGKILCRDIDSLILSEYPDLYEGYIQCVNDNLSNWLNEFSGDNLDAVNGRLSQLGITLDYNGVKTICNM